MVLVGYGTCHLGAQKRGGTVGLAQARAGREPLRGWALAKAHKVFEIQLSPLGSSPCVIQLLKGAEEQRLKSLGQRV